MISQVVALKQLLILIHARCYWFVYQYWPKLNELPYKSGELLDIDDFKQLFSYVCIPAKFSNMREIDIAILVGLKTLHWLENAK